MSKRACASLAEIPGALAKTGFILEHIVAEEFKKAGWSTIGGRYYADDVDGRARELDLVAYRSDKSKELEVVTAVLISCKKDEETTWAFLTKDKPKQDPNFDWDPLHFWTDVQPLKAYLENDTWKDDFIKAAGRTYSDRLSAKRDIFAFQQVGSEKVTPRNDRAIFDSIVTLMKALDHEMEAVPSRAKGRKRLYMFSLLSVIDAAMVDVSYSKSEPTAIEVEQLTHLARYMVRKRDLSALIHFVRSDKLPHVVDAFSKLAAANGKHFQSLIGASYAAIRESKAVQAYFSDRLKPLFTWRIDESLKRLGSSSRVEDLDLGYEDKKLRIRIDVYEEKDIRHLNADDRLKSQAAKLLKDMARYSGDFVFESDIPF